MTIDDHNIRQQVIDSLRYVAPDATGPRDRDLGATIDVDGVVREIIDRHGRISIEHIDHDTYWDIVFRHDRSQELQVRRA